MAEKRQNATALLTYPIEDSLKGALLSLSGLSHVELGHLALAEPRPKRALAIREKALGPEHPDVAIVLENYAELLRRTKRGDEAEELNARANAIRGKGEQDG